MNREGNCYSCKEFGYIIRNCRNREIVEQERRLKYGDNSTNLNRGENLIVLD